MLRFLAAALASALSTSTLLSGIPVWANDPNKTSGFVLLRSPNFTLRSPPLSATLFFAALGSGATKGTLQPKLLGSAAVYVNGVLTTLGPGHNVPTATQVVRGANILPFLRVEGGANVLGFACRFDRTSPAADPRVQAVLVVEDSEGSYNVTATDGMWAAWVADGYFNPTGDAGISWYHFSNEYLDRRAFPLGWSSPDVTPPAWPPAVEQPAWLLPLALEPGAPPAVLTRMACRATTLSPTRIVLDYGQEFMGGLNLSFTGVAAGTCITVTLAEELNPDGSVMSPARTGNQWRSVWTLAGDSLLDAGIHHHEFIQFRFAQVDGAVPSVAGAWAVQHAAGGTGYNPWEQECSHSTPAADAWGSGGGRARLWVAGLRPALRSMQCLTCLPTRLWRPRWMSTLMGRRASAT